MRCLGPGEEARDGELVALLEALVRAFVAHKAEATAQQTDADNQVGNCLRK